MIKVGEKAPDFTLKNHNGEDVKLSSFRGKKVLLSWHPRAYTGVCATQMQNLHKIKDELAARNTIGIGMSIDTHQSKHSWAKELGVLPLTMLSDFWPHGATAKAYGLFIEEDGHSGRANVLIDEQGVVIWAKQYDIPEHPDFQEVLKAIK